MSFKSLSIINILTTPIHFEIQIPFLSDWTFNSIVHKQEKKNVFIVHQFTFPISELQAGVILPQLQKTYSLR